MNSLFITCSNSHSLIDPINISAAGAVDRNLYRFFFGFLNFLAGFWAQGGVPAARSRNSGPDGLRESPR